ncbi:MAG: hypothetical protein QXP02_05560 [Desulfurococcaceae archaeon]
MPVRYVCKHCGHILFEFKKVGQDYNGIPTPEEVYRTCGGICPRCKNSLEIPRKEYAKVILIRPYIESRVPMSIRGGAVITAHA